MKKCLSFMAFAIMAVFSLAFVSCSNDDDDNDNNVSSGKTIEINGKNYEINPYMEWEGGWNEEGDNKGQFVVSVLSDPVHNTQDVWAYFFEYTAAGLPKEGDDFAKMSLTLNPMDDNAGNVWEDLTYNSGSAQVIKTNKDKDYITVKFDKLTMSGGGYNYVFDGTVDIVYNFYR